MNIETLITILIVSVVVTSVVRMLAGWTLAGWLITFVLSVLGAVVGWQVERWLNLPSLYRLPFPSTELGLGSEDVGVSVIWASVGAMVFALLGGLLARSFARAPVARSRRSRRN